MTATLPQSAPVTARVSASPPPNAASGASDSDSFAAAFDSAQRPAAASEAARAEEKSADGAASADPKAATTDPAAAGADPAAVNPAAAALLAGLVPGMTPAAGTAAPSEGGNAAAQAFVPPTSPASVAELAGQALPMAADPLATPPPPGSQAPTPEVTASTASLRAASNGDDFADVLANLGLKPAVEPAKQPVIAQPAAAAADTAADNLLPVAAPGAGGADAPALELPDVPGLVVEQTRTAEGDAAAGQPVGNQAVANQTPLAAARTHAGVLHLDTQLPVHSPRFGEGFTQQVVVLAQNGIQQAQMSLSPPDLGPIDVRITMQQDAATVQIAAASVAAREAIQDALPRLRDMLDQSGVRLNDAGVFAQLPQREQSAGSQQQRSDWQMASGFGNPGGGEQSALVAPVVRRVGLLDAYA